MYAIINGLLFGVVVALVASDPSPIAIGNAAVSFTMFLVTLVLLLRSS